MPARTYTVFMLLKATAHWRLLPETARHAVYDDALMRVFERFPAVRMRYFDASAFHGRCSDVVVWDTSDMAEYATAVASLQDTDFFGKPCFEIVDVIPSVPDGWREFEWACATRATSAYAL